MRLGDAPISTPFAPGAPIPLPWQLYFRDAGKILRNMTANPVTAGFRAVLHGNIVFIQYNGDGRTEPFPLPAAPVADCWLDRLEGLTLTRINLVAGALSVGIASGTGVVVRGWYMIDTDQRT